MDWNIFYYLISILVTEMKPNSARELDQIWAAPGSTKF